MTKLTHLQRITHIFKFNLKNPLTDIEHDEGFRQSFHIKTMLVDKTLIRCCYNHGVHCFQSGFATVIIIISIVILVRLLMHHCQLQNYVPLYINYILY